jgi:oxaloacetate decarboxylase alpha subunit
VLAGERYKNVSKELKAYFKGEYGRAPGEVNQELARKVLGDELPITTRFADTLAPEFEKTKKDLGKLARNDEDVLSYIAFPQIACKFFEEREERENRTVTYSIIRKSEGTL